MGYFNVKGQKVRCQSKRRYIVVAVRPDAIQLPNGKGTLVAFARVLYRTDNINTAIIERRKARHPRDYSPGVKHVIIDTTDGREVFEGAN